MPYLNLYALDYVILPALLSRYNPRSQRLTKQAGKRSPSEGKCWRRGEYPRSKYTYCMQGLCAYECVQPTEHVHVMFLVREARTTLEDYSPRGSATRSIAIHSLLLHLCLCRLLLSSESTWSPRMSMLTIPLRYYLHSCPKTLHCIPFMAIYPRPRESAR